MAKDLGWWPTTTGLHAVLSWREIYLVYADLNLALCLPLHAWMARHRQRGRERDLALAPTLVVGALFGRAQVVSRLVNIIFGTNLTPPPLVRLSAVSVGAVVILHLFGTWLPGAVAFAVMLGLGSGINSIARRSLLLCLFGSGGYGALTGRRASIRLIAGSTASFAFR
jgi:hypothetical protein